MVVRAAAAFKVGCHVDSPCKKDVKLLKLPPPYQNGL